MPIVARERSGGHEATSRPFNGPAISGVELSVIDVPIDAAQEGLAIPPVAIPDEERTGSDHGTDLG
jgi:hypothetical protein